MFVNSYLRAGTSHSFTQSEIVKDQMDPSGVYVFPARLLPGLVEFVHLRDL